MSVSRVLWVGCWALLIAPICWAANDAPVTVSPGTSTGSLIGDTCPTFSWGAIPGARTYELVVYRLGDEGEEAQRVLTERIAGSALGWTPQLDRCLTRGGRYAWSLRATGGEKTSGWSSPSFFEVAPVGSEAEFEEAAQIVRQYILAQGGAEVLAAAETESELASEAETGTSSAAPRAVGTTQLSVDGGVVATSFTGDGSTLTDLDPESLSAGTAAIDISGAAATAADLACTDCVSEAELAFDPATQAELDTHGGSADAHREHATLEESAEIDADITAHAGGSDHDTRYYTETEIQTSGSAAVHWDNLTSLPTTSKGDLLVGDGANVVALSVGTNGEVLVADSEASAGVAWAGATLLYRLGAPVPKTGRTTSLATGDDGDLEKGVTWPRPRFSDNSDGTVTDNLTGLIWLRDGSCSDLVGTNANGEGDWATALSAAAALASGTCGLTDDSIAGDWRLPNRFELESLLDLQFFSPALSDAAGTAKWTEGNAFSGVVSSPYHWSSTNHPTNATVAWVVYFDNGDVNHGSKSDEHYVWPVRGGQ